MSTVRKRYEILDVVRGGCLISMILYHGIYDLVYLFGWKISWYQGFLGYLWQQSICCTFIFLSGMCWSLSKNAVRRAWITSVCGAGISLVTLIFVPQERIVFGILTFMGLAMFGMIPMSRFLTRISPKAGFAVSILCFVGFRDINWGSIGFSENLRILLPQSWYRPGVMTLLGFPDAHFYSSDYFSIFPWIFLYLSGYCFFHIVKEYEVLGVELPIRFPLLSKAGRYTLLIYMLHQPMLMALLTGVSMAGRELWR